MDEFEKIASAYSNLEITLKEFIDRCKTVVRKAVDDERCPTMLGVLFAVA